MITKKLDILVPQYKEDETVIKPLLDSIAIQKGIDFNKIQVIIVNDGTDVILSDDFLNSYNYDIKYIKAEHGGISVTRNRAFNEGNAEYVMFCDDDDMFINALGLFTIFEYINEMRPNGIQGFDVLVSTFKEEVENIYGKTIYRNHKEDRTFNHGKVYRRKYLEDNNIRFSPVVPIHEDVYFNALALTISDDVKFVDNCYYMWVNNKNSTTRKWSNFVLDTIETLITCYHELVKEFMNRGLVGFARVNVANGLYRIYYESQTKKFIEHPDRKYSMEKEIQKFYKEYKYLYEKVTLDENIELLKNIKVSFLDEVLFEKINFYDWLKHIEEMQ